MDRRSFIRSASTASAIALMGGGFARAALAQGAGQAGPADAKLASLMDRMFDNFIDTTPELATVLGLDKGPRAALKPKLFDYSKVEAARPVAAAKVFQTELKAVGRASLSEASKRHYYCSSEEHTSELQ